jgi:predicted RNA-binding Zn-ribbon protein involved in translation (DUF1610 family)
LQTLFLDIETTPGLADVWGIWNQNVGLNQLRESPGLLCFAAKFADEAEVDFISDHHHGREVMVRSAHYALDQADVVVTWNGKRFDIPHLNREFLEMGFKPPSPFKQVDLCEVAKRVFKFPSNKLQYVSTALGFGGKVEHEGHLLWVKCMEGDKDAWERMKEYNIQDVLLLEELYPRFLPWIPTHPSHAAEQGKEVCPKCGSAAIQRRGYAMTAQTRYQRYQCQGCGAWSRSTERDAVAHITEVRNA